MKIDLENGLNKEQVKKSRKRYGENSLPKQRSFTVFGIIIEQFKSPLVLILIIAAIVTVILELPNHDNILQIPEFVAIILVVIINATLGFFQEFKAQNTLESLKSSLKDDATVIRDGSEVTINIDEVVVGDIIVLKFGDKVPADGMCFDSSNISVSEAAITGETAPVYKFNVKKEKILDKFPTHDLEDKYILKKGTGVVSGFGKCLVTHVGEKTEFGKIAKTVTEDKDTLTPLQKKLSNLSKIISVLALIASSLVFVIGFMQNIPIHEIFELSISLAVSSVPEALVISITVVLTVGLTRLLNKKALVRKLIVAETLGSVTTICVDKTGTLTLGEMEVVDVQTNDSKKMLKALYFNNNHLNSVDKAVSHWLESKNVKSQISDEKVLDKLPFDSKNKFSISVNSKNIYFVGAPDILLDESNLDKDEKEKWINKIEEITLEGKRLIAAAFKSNNDNTTEAKTELLKDLEWLGLIIIEDPVRQDVSDVLLQTVDAGIDIKVITGDFKNTALNVLKTIKFDVTEKEILSGKELKAMSDTELSKKIKNIKLFYRTNPEQKLKIVEALQKKDEAIAMMGDGINDAPALKKANVGIVVNNATEVSKDTADIVLLDSNFKTIIAAIEEGRSIFANIKKILTYLLTGTFDEIILIAGSVFLGFQAALSPLQILYINIIVDGLPDLAMSFEPKEDDVLNKKNAGSKRLFDKEMISVIFTIGVIVSFFLLGTYYYLLGQNYSIERIRTIIFTIITVNSLLYVFSIKSLNKNIWSYSIFNNRILNISVIFGFISILLAFAIPGIRSVLELTDLSNMELFYIGVICVVNILLIEIIKYLFIHRIIRK